MHARFFYFISITSLNIYLIQMLFYYFLFFVLKAKLLIKNYDWLNLMRERLWYAEHTNEKKRREEE